MKYPIKKKMIVKKRNYSKLGMSLEKDINQTNNFYLVNDIAIIHKKPTPIQLVSVKYPSRTKAKITEAYFKSPSTTDYNGLYKGFYIDFDCKESSNKTSFPLSNIHTHQREHLKKIHYNKGISFLIIHFKFHKTYFLLPYKSLEKFLDGTEKRKSIPYEKFKKIAYEIQYGLMPRLDYLKIIDKHLLF